MDRRGRVKVADFGLAKLVGTETGRAGSPLPADGAHGVTPPTDVLTESGKVMGTPNYMAPEQKEHPDIVDNRADIYALGVVFYQMLTGELPGKKIAPPSSKVQIDVRLDEIVLRALEKNPELRYQQVSEVKTMVETIVGTPPGSSRSEEAQTESERRKAESGKSGESLVTSAATNQVSRFSRTGIAGAIFAGLGIAMTILPLKTLAGVPAAFVATILGWMAVSQIRRSAGKLHGMWLAVFDGLFFPLLALDFLIWFVCNVSLHQLLRESSEPATRALVAVPAFGVAAVICILLNIIIARLVWRVVNKSVATPAPPVQKPDRFWRWFAVAVFAMIAIPFLISIFGLLAAIAIPNFVKARAQSQANARHAAAQMRTNQPAAQNLSFGPVIERVIQARQTGTNLFLDLDTGELFTPPVNITETLGNNDRNWETLDIPEDLRSFRYIQWLRESGADLMFAGDGKVIGFDGAFPFAHGNNSTNWESWDGLTPAQVQNDVAVIEWGRKVDEAKLRNQPWPPAPQPGGVINSAMQIDSSSPGGPLVNLLTLKQSAMWFFKTRAGGMGILQITGFTDNPRGVKIRYKLVQNINNNQSEPSTDQSDMIHKLNEQLNGTKAIILRQQAELEELSKLNNAQLRDVLPQLTKDSSLEAFLRDLDAAQLQLKVLNAASNPDPKVRQVLTNYIDETDKKIDDRMSGLVFGLKTQVKAEEASMGQLRSMRDQLRNPTNSETK
jgi:type II secretory pathway pseudopilin PulG